MSARRKRYGVGEEPVGACFYLFVEGDTEKYYFKNLTLNTEPRGRFSFVVVNPDRDPYKIAQSALDKKKENSINKLDLIWCVFDTESQNNRPNLTPAVELANKEKLKLAVSNPCFEIWLIWHHQDLSSEESAKGLKSIIEKKNYPVVLDKVHVESDRMHVDDPKIAAARKRALHLEKQHKDNNLTFPSDNPSSTVYKIFVAIEILRKINFDYEKISQLSDEEKEFLHLQAS